MDSYSVTVSSRGVYFSKSQTVPRRGTFMNTCHQAKFDEFFILNLTLKKKNMRKKIKVKEKEKKKKLGVIKKYTPLQVEPFLYQIGL